MFTNRARVYARCGRVRVCGRAHTARSAARVDQRARVAVFPDPRRVFAALGRRRVRVESVSCSCCGWRCTSGTKPQEIQTLKNRARGICKLPIPMPHAACSYCTHQLSLRCSGSLPVVAWAAWTSPAASPPAIKSKLLVASLALNGLDLRRACRRIYAHPAAAPRSVLFD